MDNTITFKPRRLPFRSIWSCFELGTGPPVVCSFLFVFIVIILVNKSTKTVHFRFSKFANLVKFSAAVMPRLSK
jgi:hypothetical protein